MPEFSAGKVTDYADGDRKVIDCGESEVGIFKIDREFFAWHNRCAHRAGPVCQGRIMKRVIEPVADDRTIRAFAESRELERLPTDPAFKEIAL